MAETSGFVRGSEVVSDVDRTEYLDLSSNGCSTGDMKLCAVRPLELKEQDSNLKGTDLTLMEEVLLLGMEDEAGSAPVGNDNLSQGLRGSILLELAMRGRIALKSSTTESKDSSTRTVVIKDDTPTGDGLLDEVLDYIKEEDGLETIKTWMDYFLCGRLFWTDRYQLRHVHARVFKSLVTKRVLSTRTHDYLLFKMTTYPLVYSGLKKKLVQRVQDVLLWRWTDDVRRVDQRTEVLVYILSIAGVLDKCLASMSKHEAELAKRHHVQLYEVRNGTHFKSGQDDTVDVMCGVVKALLYYN